MADAPANRLTPAPFAGLVWIPLGFIAGGWVFVWGVIVAVQLVIPAEAAPHAPLVLGSVGVAVLVFAGVVLHGLGQLGAAGLAGMVVVAVDDQPFAPGGTYRGRVTPTGLFRLTLTGVKLVCEEVAVYATATGLCSDGKTVARVAAEKTGPLDFAVTVPTGAMHSFKAAHNEIAWTLRLAGRVGRVLPYRMSFQVVVQPGGGDAG
jgi:hypothetical protein